MDEERLLSPDADESDKSLEKSLRPRYLAQYIGQDKVKQELSIYIEAAKNRQEALDHVLLYGPPGLGMSWSLGMSCLSMRFTVCRGLPKKHCIQRWRIIMWISWWGKVQPLIPYIFLCHLLL